MNSDNKRAPHDVDDDFDGESHAADEPTAVWDESALRAAGLSDLLKKRESEPPPPPATAPTPVSTTESSIVVDASSIVPKEPVSIPAKVATPVPQAPAHSRDEGGLGWGATLSIAIALGAVVYALIRYLKG